MTKILLVEDDKSLREIYGVRLLAEGYDIVSAGDGEEALAMAIKDRPDLIVSDVMMPKISGFDMLDILRSTTETKGIKVIMMTALSSEEQRLRGVALGADRYLVKSQVGIEDVVRTVHEVLGDAPVTTQAPAFVVPAVTPAPAVAPVPIAMTPPAPIPTPMPVPIPPVAAPISIPVAAPVAPVTAPIEIPAPTPVPVAITPAPITPVAPVSFSSPATAPPEAILPQPSAPFSTPRTTGNTLANRVIQPLETPNESPDFGNLMSQALSQDPAQAAPAAPAPAMQYEETPRIEAAPVIAQPLPTPPQAPNPGV